MPIVNDSRQDLKVAQRTDLKSPHHRKKRCNCVWGWVLTRPIVVIVSPYMQTLKKMFAFVSVFVRVPIALGIP